jgi:hypothetical protein
MSTVFLWYLARSYVGSMPAQSTRHADMFKDVGHLIVLTVLLEMCIQVRALKVYDRVLFSVQLGMA